jgi:hypothetical protein
MKILGRSISNASLALLLIQLALVSTVAAKYEYERWRCPRVWTRAVGYDLELPLRGRYLGLQLRVDGCASTLPSAAQARFPRDINGAATPGPYFVRGVPAIQFRANLKVENNRLEAIRIPDLEQRRSGQVVNAWPGKACDEMTLGTPVFYYVRDGAPRLLPPKAGQELWVEATIPQQGPPRPTQLAIKQNSNWTPVAF